MRAAVGAVIVAFAAMLAENRLRGRHAVIALRPAGDLAAGAVAGAATALVGMSGPPVLIYLMLAGAPAPTVRATLLSFFALIYAATVAANALFFGMPGGVWIAAASSRTVRLDRGAPRPASSATGSTPASPRRWRSCCSRSPASIPSP